MPDADEAKPIARFSYNMSEFTDEEHLALSLCLAALEPEKFAQSYLVTLKAAQAAGATPEFIRKSMNIGIERLSAKGIIENAERDGHRDWNIVPGKTGVHLEMIIDDIHLVSRATSGLITGEGQ